jgi:ABC-type sugar transport system ATPase subunit
MDRTQPIIEMCGIHKYFPGVHALRGVSFDLYPGEVHALVGENGAGKSTLIKLMSGVYPLDEGAYRFGGTSARITSPHDAIRRGLSVIYQELNLVGSLSVAENIFFGRLPSSGGRVLWRKLYEDTQGYLDRVGLKIRPGAKVHHLSVAQQQLAEIAKAISLNAKVLVMDEPTSALSPNEIRYLFDVIRQLKAEGVAVIYVSHKLEEVFTVADRITVLRDGAAIGTVSADQVDQATLIEMMVGRKLTDMFPPKNRTPGRVLLDVGHLSSEKVTDLSFTVRAGEIVGFSGLMGAGRTEMTRALFGIDPRTGGTVTLDGKPVRKDSPVAARLAGLGLVTENRKEEGILPTLSVKKNVSIVSLNQVSRLINISRRRETSEVKKIVGAIQIKTPSIDQLVSKLSGGNQQKVLLARWMIKEDLKLLIVDEPTRGIDVGAKAEIYEILNNLARDGLSILIVSSEMPEILGLCDRIYVMKDGRITGEFKAGEASEAALLAKAIR